MKRRPEPGDNADKRSRASAADAEAEAFARAMADVVRVPRDPRGRVRPAPLASAPRAVPRTPSSGARVTSDVSESGFVAPGVDRRELRKLKRGDYAPASRLDLHGQTAAEAVASLQRFIDNSRHRHRCVCIVHGYGLHSRGNLPILKTRVREWLRQHRDVLAYADAPRTDGGTGAVYALLRK